ncbi:hypothetical protein [Streptomyces chartreusis]|uniref:Uncharacterized protein n=1 Tax=Streptomyces chartreusis TaxID=1969 RepID=A0A7I0NSI2_STRCX|nr:hypothetical protein [Streptomyces chartreusis]QKZ16025.1 hypothetical protein HUT05_00640 [Streptomyces chartreusis]
MTVILTPPGQELRLLASLASWTGPAPGPDGREVAHILITHTPALTDDSVEARMRRLSDTLGGLTGPPDVVPQIDRCLQIVGDQVLVHFPGASRKLRLPTRRPRTELVARNSETVLLLGLDPPPQTADAARLDTYLDDALAPAEPPGNFPHTPGRTGALRRHTRKLPWKPSNAPGWTSNSPGSPPRLPPHSRPRRS